MPNSESKPLSGSSDSPYRIKSLTDNPSDSPDSPLSYQTDIAVAYLSSTTKLEDLHTSLLHSLSAAGWTERVRLLALELLRSGQCTRFEQVVDTVVRLATTKPNETSSSAVLGKRKRDINNDGKEKPPQKQQKQQNGATASSSATTTTNGTVKKEVNANGTGTTGVNGVQKSTTETATTENDLSLNPDFDVHIPPQVVAKGVKSLREALDDVFIPSPSTDDEDGEEDRADNDGELVKPSTASKDAAK